MNVIAGLPFKLTYFEGAVQYISYYAMWTPIGLGSESSFCGQQQ